MEVPGCRRRAISSVLALSIFMILILVASALVYMDSTQALDSRISSLQSQVNALSGSAQSNPQGQPSGTQVTPTTRHITLIAQDAKLKLAPNVTYDGWSFNGTIPGPTITVNQGDLVNFKLINNVTTMAHSIDFHAAQVDWATDYASVAPGESKTFSFTVDYPGVFMYHCGTPPVLEHISNGMYGAIIVNPSTPLPPAPGGQYVLVQSEFYLNARPGPDGAYAGNRTKMLAATPSYVVFNGRANQYVQSPLTVKPNELVRLYILNVGPDHWSAFHVIGALMDTVYIDGNPANAQRGLQTLNIPPSGGAIVDMYFRDPGGKNPFVTHDFADASIGATGVFVVQSGTSGTTSVTTSTQGVVSGTTVHVSTPLGSATNTASLGYSPATIIVVIGVNNTVVWTNNDNAPHTVTALGRSFDSGNMNTGDTFAQTFTTPGTYAYTCSYHPWMKGTVIVKAS